MHDLSRCARAHAGGAVSVSAMMMDTDSLLDRLPAAPFTARDLDALSLTRPELRRLLHAGEVRRVLLGAYVRADVPDSTEIRARSLALVCSPHVVVVDRTAAWLW